MTEAQIGTLKKALLHIEMLEIKKMEALPVAEWKLSQKHLDTVDSIISRERRRENSVLKLSVKKKMALLIASILIVAMTLTACLFGKQIGELLIEFRDNLIGFTASEDSGQIPYKEYEFSYIPEGYELKNSLVESEFSSYVYYNGIHHISLLQGTIYGSRVNIDTEDGTYETVTINGHLIYYNNTKNTYSVAWKIDGNVFTISCHNSIGWNEVEKIILGAIPKE